MAMSEAIMQMAEKFYDVIIVGAGPAGLAAAISARKQNASVLVIDREDTPGGILRQCIHHGFGLHYFQQDLTGPEYATKLTAQAMQAGAEILLSTMVLEIDHAQKKLYAMQQGAGVRIFSYGALVLATGCRERTRGALKIPGTRPSGIYSAGTAQRLINMEGYLPGKRVVILGSGDIGLIMARRLTWEGAKVLCVLEAMPFSGGLLRNIAQCLDDYDIPLHLSHTVTQIHGQDRLTGVTVAKVGAGFTPISGTEQHISCDTLLLSVGLIPENELARSLGLKMDEITGGAVVDQNRASSVEGVYCCGNALLVHDLADDASIEGHIAGEHAARFAKTTTENQEIKKQCRRLVAGQGIRFCVPQLIGADVNEITVLMRVSQPTGKAMIVAKCQGQPIAKRTSLCLSPGNIESLTIKGLTNQTGDVTLTVQEVL